MATLVMVESWLRSAGWALPPVIRELGHRYVLAARDPALYDGHPASRLAEEVAVIETNDVPALCRWAEERAARHGIDGVVTTCDYYLPAVATVAHRLGLPGAPVPAMACATLKHLVRAALDEAGVPNIRWAVAAGWPELAAAAARLGYPLVAKPVDLNAGTDVRLVHDEADLKDAFHQITGPAHNSRGQARHRLVLVEDVMTGTEVSVEAVTVDGATTVVGITDKSVVAAPAFVESGHMFPAALRPADAAAVQRFVSDVLAALGFDHGLSHSEVMVTAAGPRLVELNPRQGGGHIFDLVQLVTGTHPLRLLVDLALGEVPEVGTAAAPLPGAAFPGGSAAVHFVIPPRAGEIVTAEGAAALVADPRVHRFTLPVPALAARPDDNEAYLGHVVTVDPTGARARAYAEQIVGGIGLRYRDGSLARSLSAAGPHGVLG